MAFEVAKKIGTIGKLLQVTLESGMNFRSVKLAAAGLVSVLLLAGCDLDTVSYGITGRNHSITLIRDRPFFWSQKYNQNVIVANMPECQRRYRLQQADVRKPYNVQIYDYGTFTHLWIVQDQYYLFDHINCRFEYSKTAIQPPTSEDAYIGEFYEDENGRLSFKNARAERIRKQREQEKLQQMNAPAPSPLPAASQSYPSGDSQERLPEERDSGFSYDQPQE